MSDDEASESIGSPAIAVGHVDGVAKILMIAGDLGEVAVFPVLSAAGKTALRFASGLPGRRGTVWRVWANKSADDVYIGTRNKAGEFKISLHQSGDWRVQLVSPDQPKTVVFRKLADAGEGRILDQWRRPDANDVGWTHALSMVLPEHHLVDIPDDAVKWQDVRWCDEPAAGEQLEFQVHLVKPGLGLMSYQQLLGDGGRVVVMDALELAGGEVVVVLAIWSTPDIAESESMRRSERETWQHLPPPEEFDPDPGLGPRAMTFGPGPSGERRFYDFAHESLSNRS